MKKVFVLLSILLLTSVKFTDAQEQQQLLTSGPMLGFVEHRSALIWCEVSQEVRHATIRYWEFNNAE